MSRLLTVSTMLVVGFMLVSESIQAESSGLTLREGLWETTTTRTNPMTGEPTTSTERNCVEEQRDFQPEELMQNARECSMTRNELSGDSLDFEMECNMQGATSTISGYFEIGETTGRGKMNIDMSMGGMNMSMKMDWESERVGSC